MVQKINRRITQNDSETESTWKSWNGSNGDTNDDESADIKQWFIGKRCKKKKKYHHMY